MKYYSLARDYRNRGWYLHPLTGNLHQVSSDVLSQFQLEVLPQKVLDALQYCQFPYSLQPPDFGRSYALDEKQLQTLDKFYERIVFLRKINFWLVNWYAGNYQPLFDNSLQAFHALARQNRSAKTDRVGCLNRTLAVAKCSIEFKKSGVLFIGADLPQTSLHAWIIEKDYQPDAWDRNWINYLPIAAYAYCGSE
jgi:hypothetical protein